VSTINIHGKEYEPVASRIGRFRAERPSWTLTTEILVDDGERVLMRAVLLDEDGRIVATGHAEELRQASRINKTSAVENCETSAIGRCLGIAGYDLAGQVATAEEVTHAIEGDQLAKARAWFGARELTAERRQEVDTALEAANLRRLRALRQAELAGDARIAAKAPKTAANGTADNIPAAWRDESLRASKEGRE
jgi:hypothetical protein|tara:strand:+ start:460 stop:1041 length:582 start_codon:yes stop_codon:yes gene_type:complete